MIIIYVDIEKNGYYYLCYCVHLSEENAYAFVKAKCIGDIYQLSIFLYNCFGTACIM